ncbi:uncharacterized protein [Montipora foliosa]|uniref:uncharacterized protein n=1 Tax=Montipora foliosa TaxID=591990 RepID=UPI0035F20CA9
MKEKIVYEKIRVSLNRYRRQEIRMAGSFTKKNSSFARLFEQRIDEIGGRRVRVSVTVFVTIRELTKEKIIKRSFGPFDTVVPKLSLEDMYKFFMYKLLTSNFTLLSADVITEIGGRVITYNPQFFAHHFMAGLKLESYLLSGQRKPKSYGSNSCVLDYVWDQVRGKRGFKTYDYDKLKDEIFKYCADPPRMTTKELIDWAKYCHPNLSVHAYDSTYRKFKSHIRKNNCDVSLVYIVKDHHCYPITDEKLKLTAAKANQGGCNDLLKYMTDMKWTRNHESVFKLDKFDDIHELDKKDNIIVLPEDVKMMQAIDAYINSTCYYVEYLHWNNNGILDGFIDHRNNMFLLNDEYDIRKSICDHLLGLYKTHDFMWVNQTYTGLASALFKQLCGYLPQSTYNVHTREMLDDFYPRALQWCTTEDIPDDVVNIDISKSYPNVLLNNGMPIPVYSIHDVVEPFYSKSDLGKCGEFYIEETILYNYGTPLKIEAGFYSNALVSYLVDELNMSVKQIKYKIVSKKALKPDTFKPFLKYVFETFSESKAKRLANSFIGDLGRKYNRTNTGFTCVEYDTAMACWTQGIKDGRNIVIDSYNEIYLIKEQKCERLFSDNTSVNRFVVSQAILKCLELLRKCYGEKSALYAYNTDGIFITNPRVILENKKDVVFDIKNIGKAYITDSPLCYFERHYRENMNFDSYKAQKGEGCMYNGQAGSGKTTKLCKMVKETEKPIVLSFTNKAVQNVKDKLKKMQYNGDDICHTFDSYFCEWNGLSSGTNLKSLEDKTIFIEEFSMVPNKWITLIYKAFVLYGIKVYMFGDPNQCSPVESGSKICYDYLKSISVRQMCPQNVTLEYIEDSCRYDKKTHIVLDGFLKKGKMAKNFGAIDASLFKNVCYLNKTRIEVNTRCCDKFVEGKEHELVEFVYNDKKEKYKVCAEMPVIATDNIKEHKIFNTMEFLVESVAEDSFWINGEEFDLKTFSRCFIPSFCVTAHKCQGADIDEPYNIYDVNKMDKKLLYTALSRTTKFKYIHLDNTELNNKYVERKMPFLELTNAKFNSLYSEGKIYKVLIDDKVYIGSTCEDLETRLNRHLKDPKSQIYKYRKKKPVIELLVKAPTNDKRSLEKIENAYIQDYAEKCGELLLNVKANPLKPKKVQFKVQMENQKQLEERIAKLDVKIKIKDNENDKYLYYDNIIFGKRYKTKARYANNGKEAALEQISEKKRKLIEELTVHFD